MNSRENNNRILGHNK